MIPVPMMAVSFGTGTVVASADMMLVSVGDQITIARMILIHIVVMVVPQVLSFALLVPSMQGIDHIRRVPVVLRVLIPAMMMVAGLALMLFRLHVMVMVAVVIHPIAVMAAAAIRCPAHHQVVISHAAVTRVHLVTEVLLKQVIMPAMVLCVAPQLSHATMVVMKALVMEEPLLVVMDVVVTLAVPECLVIQVVILIIVQKSQDKSNLSNRIRPV